jgi:hypothetical protein
MLGQKKYVAIQEFTSPTLGNVYMGKEVFLPQRTAQKFIEAGLFEEVKAKQKQVVSNGGRNNSGAGKGSSEGNPK